LQPVVPLLGSLTRTQVAQYGDEPRAVGRQRLANRHFDGNLGAIAVTTKNLPPAAEQPAYLGTIAGGIPEASTAGIRTNDAAEATPNHFGRRVAKQTFAWFVEDEDARTVIGYNDTVCRSVKQARRQEFRRSPIGQLRFDGESSSSRLS
jgi:hypothetical protein